MSNGIPLPDDFRQMPAVASEQDRRELEAAGPEVVEWARRLVWLERVGLVAVGAIDVRAHLVARAAERSEGHSQKQAECHCGHGDDTVA